MRIALAHDYLNQLGGAEEVLMTLTEIFPNSPIYTLNYSPEKTHYLFKKHQENNLIKTSALNYLPLSKSHHRIFIPFMPLFSQSLRIEDYDLVFSDSAGFAKNFNIKSKLHIAYCHSPLRYAWEEDYLTTKIKISANNFIIKKILKYLRDWDYEGAQKPDILIANSKFIAEKIERYYNRKAIVIYPPVDRKIFFYNPKVKKENYFLAVGRLMHYKRFDLIIKSFNKLQLPLIVIGNGPEEKKLKKLNTSPKTQFVDFITDKNKLSQFYSQAKALIFPQIEDFGLVAAEAQSSGLPVIAYKEGGAREIIIDKQTGIFLNHQDSEELIEKILDFEKYNFNPEVISQSAERFSKENFKTNIQKLISQFL